MTPARRPSPLQRSILIVLAALDIKRPGPVRTRDLERMLAEGGDRPVYGPNLRTSCRRMEAAGWLRLLRAPNLQLAVGLTEAGRTIAAELLAAEKARVQAEQRASQVRVLPLVPAIAAGRPGPSGDDVPVSLDGIAHTACRGDFVIRLDGTTCLQLRDTGGRVTRLEGDPLRVADWLRACHDAGVAVGVQVNESPEPEDEGNAECRERAEFSALLDALAQRSLFCNRSRLTAILFSPVRDANETWTERLKWLLGGELAEGFGFCSPQSRDTGSRALEILAGYTGQEVAEHLATVTAWNDAGAGERA